jgi:hypothetical protein
MDDRKENFFSAKIASGEALFPPLVKAKNQHQKQFWRKILFSIIQMNL